MTQNVIFMLYYYKVKVKYVYNIVRVHSTMRSKMWCEYLCSYATLSAEDRIHTIRSLIHRVRSRSQGWIRPTSWGQLGDRISIAGLISSREGGAGGSIEGGSYSCKLVEYPPCKSAWPPNRAWSRGYYRSSSYHKLYHTVMRYDLESYTLMHGWWLQL